MQAYIVPIVGLSVTMWVLLFVGGHVLRRQVPNPVTQLRALKRIMLLLAAVLTPVAIWSRSRALTEPVAAALGLDAYVWYLSQIPVVAGVLVVLTTGYLGIFPHLRAERGIDVGVTSAAAGFLRDAAAAVVVVTIGLDLYVIAVKLLPLPVAILVASAVILALLAFGGHIIVALARRMRDPSPDEVATIRAHCDAVGLDVDRIRIVDANLAEAAVRGPPWNRHLDLTDTVLTYPDDELRATLAVLAADSDRRLPPVRLIAFVLCGAVFAWGLDPLRPAVAIGAVVLAVASYLGISAYLRRRTFAVDRDAAERVGAEPVAAAIGRRAAINDEELFIEPPGQKLLGSLAPGPRIRALRERDDHPLDPDERPTRDELPTSDGDRIADDPAVAARASEPTGPTATDGPGPDQMD